MSRLLSVKGVQSSYKINLLLAGHLCAGQVRLPLIGALCIPGTKSGTYEWFPENQKVQGLYKVSDVYQYISPGLGTCSRYPVPMRIFNTPSVSLITLTGKLTK